MPTILYVILTFLVVLARRKRYLQNRKNRFYGFWFLVNKNGFETVFTVFCHETVTNDNAYSPFYVWKLSKPFLPFFVLLNGGKRWRTFTVLYLTILKWFYRFWQKIILKNTTNHNIITTWIIPLQNPLKYAALKLLLCLLNNIKILSY